VAYPESFLQAPKSTPPEQQIHAAHSKGGEGLLFCLSWPNRDNPRLKAPSPQDSHFPNKPNKEAQPR
jgi:hypothetical protein